MASLLIEVGGKQLLAGLSWRELLDPSRARQEVNEYAAELKANYLVRLDGSRGSYVGLAQTDGKLPTKGVYSLAALFATSPQVSGTALLFMDISLSRDDQVTLLVGVRNGMPHPGFDAVGSRQAMMDLANEFMQLSGSRNVTVYSNTRAFQQSRAIDLSDLIHSNIKAARVSGHSPGRGKWVFAAAIVVATAVGGVGWYVWEEQKAEEARRAAQKQDPNLIYEQMLPGALQSVSVRPRQFADQVLPRIWGMPSAAAGWKVATIECASDVCLTKWGAGVGTNATFSETFPDAVPEYDLNGAWLKVSMPVETPVLALERGSLPTLRTFLHDTGSKFQLWTKAGWRYQLSQPSVFSLPPGVDAAVIRNPVMTGDWESSGDFWMLASALAELPDHLAIDQVVLSQNQNKITFALRGKFYVLP